MYLYPPSSPTVISLLRGKRCWFQRPNIVKITNAEELPEEPLSEDDHDQAETLPISDQPAPFPEEGCARVWLARAQEILADINAKGLPGQVSSVRSKADKLRFRNQSSRTSNADDLKKVRPCNICVGF